MSTPDEVGVTPEDWTNTYAPTASDQHWTMWLILRRPNERLLVTQNWKRRDWTAEEINEDPVRMTYPRPHRVVLGTLSMVLDQLAEDENPMPEDLR